MILEVDGKAATEIEAALEQTNKIRQLLDQNKDRLCPFGGVLIGGCSHVQQLQRGTQPGDVQRAHALEQMEAQRSTEWEQVLAQHDQLRQTIQSQETQRDLLLEEQRKMLEQVHTLDAARTALAQDLDQLVGWALRVEAPEKSQQTKFVVKTIEDLKVKIEAERNRLNQLLANHDENRDLLNRIFSEAARLVLPSANYDGAVRFDDRELNFQITHGGAMSGEAIETLAVLLADFTCVIFNLLSSESHLPGFLLHDSPREADLSLRLYHIPGAKWINLPSQNAAAGHKLEQLQRAETMGFEVPQTLVTQVPGEMRQFWRACSGRVVIKPLSHGHLDHGSRHELIYTNALRETDLKHVSLIRRCPTLLQKRVEKSADICLEGCISRRRRQSCPAPNQH